MKKVRICFEVQGLAVEEDGAPAPAGMEFTMGEVPDDQYETAMNSVRAVKALDILRYLGLDSLASVHTESDFKLMTPEDYDKLYGDTTGIQSTQDEED